MLDLYLIVAILIALLGTSSGVWFGYRWGRERTDHLYSARWGPMLEELADLRHLKTQLENGPPLPHDHLWPREPDVRKMGWLRYRCVRCREIKWEAS